MYKTLIANIKNTLESIKAVKAVYARPLTGASKVYPMVWFSPANSENSFQSNGENFKVFKFNLLAEILVEGVNEDLLYEDILPSFVDKIYDEFDKNWGGLISNKRMWWILNDDNWVVSEEGKGRLASVNMTLTVKVSKSI